MRLMVVTKGETGRKQGNKNVLCNIREHVVSVQVLKVSLFGVGTVFRLERDAWSMFKRLRQAASGYAPPPLSLRLGP